MLSDKAIAQLEKVKACIKAHPEHYNQNTWITAACGTACGTAGCIAGWVVMNNRRDRKWFNYPINLVLDSLQGDWSIMDRARELLGLNLHQACKLFGTGEAWPEECWDDYREAMEERDYAKAAQVACQRIDIFIASNGTL